MLSRLKEIHRYKYLLYNLVSRDLKVKYNGSILGFFWSLLNPLVMLFVYTLAFRYIIKVRVENFPLFFLCAFLPWSFLNISLSMSVSSIKDNASLVKKVYFPREILPFSIVFSNLIQFLLTFIILIPALLIFGTKMGFPLFVVPFIILFQTAFLIGLSYIVAALNVFFSDVKHLLEIFLQVWFWLTPIIYPITYVPEQYQFWYRLNPFVRFVESYRDCLLYNKMPSVYSLLVLFIIGVAVFLIGQLVFNFYNKRFAEEI